METLKHIWNGLVAGATAIKEYVIEVSGSAVDTFKSIKDSGIKYASVLWARTKMAWENNHGIRAVGGLLIGSLALPIFVIAAPVASLAVAAGGLIVIPALFIGAVGLVLGLVGAVAAVYGLVRLIGWASKVVFGREAEVIEA